MPCMSACCVLSACVPRVAAEAGLAAALAAAGLKLPSGSGLCSRSISRAGSKAGSLGPSSAGGRSMDGGSTKASSIISSSSSRNKLAAGMGKIGSIKNISFG